MKRVRVEHLLFSSDTTSGYTCIDPVARLPSVYLAYAQPEIFRVVFWYITMRQQGNFQALDSHHTGVDFDYSFRIHACVCGKQN